MQFLIRKSEKKTGFKQVIYTFKFSWLISTLKFTGIMWGLLFIFFYLGAFFGTGGGEWAIAAMYLHFKWSGLQK